MNFHSSWILCWQYLCRGFLQHIALYPRRDTQHFTPVIYHPTTLIFPNTMLIQESSYWGWGKEWGHRGQGSIRQRLHMHTQCNKGLHSVVTVTILCIACADNRTVCHTGVIGMNCEVAGQWPRLFLWDGMHCCTLPHVSVCMKMIQPTQFQSKGDSGRDNPLL